MSAIYTAGITCWNCHRLNDGHTNADGSDDRLEQGAMSICIACGAWAIFVVVDGEPTHVRPPTQDEWVELSTDMSVLRAAALRIKVTQEQEK